MIGKLTVVRMTTMGKMMTMVVVIVVVVVVVVVGGCRGG